jgi:phosphoserine phosphatase RsbU/P
LLRFAHLSDVEPKLTERQAIHDLEDLYERAPVGYLSMRSDGLIVRVNATLADWVGHPKEELLGTRLQELLTVATRIFFETNVQPVLNVHGKFSEIFLELRASNGEKLPVFAHATVRHVADRPAPLVRLALTQAHERRRYERELSKAQTDAESSFATTQVLLKDELETAHLREQFIAVLGHDLRNPLGSISNGIHLLKRELPADHRERVLAMVAGSASRMGGLIDNVLDLARGRLGAGIPVELQAGVMLTPVIEQVVSELRISAIDRIIETSLELSKPIECDPSRIGQLISNLLGNALTHGAKSVPVRVHAQVADDQLTIWVANGGIPISAEAMDRLFQPFFRGEVRNSLQGLGLGLYIASEIAKAHGGSLVATSSPDETRFTFAMPVVRREVHGSARALP